MILFAFHCLDKNQVRLVNFKPVITQDRFDQQKILDDKKKEISQYSVGTLQHNAIYL